MLEEGRCEQRLRRGKEYCFRSLCGTVFRALLTILQDRLDGQP